MIALIIILILIVILVIAMRKKKEDPAQKYKQDEVEVAERPTPKSGKKFTIDSKEDLDGKKGRTPEDSHTELEDDELTSSAVGLVVSN